MARAKNNVPRPDGPANWSENQHQAAIFRWAREEIAAGRLSLVALGAIPNGHGQLSGCALGSYERLGFKLGMPDLFYLLPRRPYHGLFIELKSLNRRSKARGSQIGFADVLRANGYRVEICRGYENAIAVINDYENGK